MDLWSVFSAGFYVTVYFCHLTLQSLVNWFRKSDYLMVKNDHESIKHR
jgi:hypothetical protein